MTYEMIRISRGSKYSDQSGSLGSSMQNSIIMSTNTGSYEHARHEDDKSQVGITIASLYYKNNPVKGYNCQEVDTSFIGFTSNAVQSEQSDQQVTRTLRRRKIAIILVLVVLLAVAAAITLPVILTLRHPDTQPDKITVARMSVTVDQTFEPEYNDINSSEFKSFAHEFSIAMDKIYKESTIKGYLANQVEELKPFQIHPVQDMSINVTFIVVFEVRQTEEPPRVEEIKAVVSEQPGDKSDNTIVIVSNFRIRQNSVYVDSVEKVKANPITTIRTTSATIAITLTTRSAPPATRTPAISTATITPTTKPNSITTTSTVLLPCPGTYCTSIQASTSTKASRPTSIMTTTSRPTTTSSLTNLSVAFNIKYYTAVVGVPLQLICTVTGWNGNLSLSRLSRTSQQEVMVVNFANNETGTILNGFAVNITFSGYNVDVSIFILNASCEYEGWYYCTSGAASDNATVKRKREKPILQLPDIMIRDNYHSVKYPFACEADIENPGEILIAEVNKNVTFYFYEGYYERRVNITTDCGTKQRFTFYFNGKFTSDWDNAKIRCVVINNVTNGDTGIRLVSEESTIRLVPADICVGVPEGSNISYLQSDCELFLTCLSGVPVPGKCQQGQCFYDNIGICRAPKCPFIYCKDADANIGDLTSITCSLLFCNDSFALSIKHHNDSLFNNNNITGNISQRSDDRDIQVSVISGKAEVTVTLIKTNCSHSGEYLIILDRGEFTDRVYLTLKVPPRKPTLLLPQSIVAYTQATITCTGEQGVPRQNMYMEVMFGGSNFTKYENTILTTDDKNCSSMGTLVMNFIVAEKWQGARVRCIIGDNSSSRLESDVYDINTTSSGVIISPSEITGFINDTVQINCTVTGILSNDSVIISRLTPTFQGEEILSILTIGNSTKNNLTGIRFSTTILSENDTIIHININFLQCKDGGTYYCKTGNRTATTSLVIWSIPNKPSLMLPLDVVSDGYNHLGDPFVCKGNVGYPGGNLLALIKSNGTFKEIQPFKVNLTKGNVSNCQKVDRLEFYLSKFTTDLHNSTLRCVATNNETLPIGQLAPYDEKVLLLVPGTACYGMVDGVVLPYPYPFDDCKKYLYCTGNRTFVKDVGCTDGECYYTDMKRCELERTTTTIVPTTTTQATCPFIRCLGAEALINSAVAINCQMILCGSDFDLNIDLNSTVLFRETIHGNRSSIFLANSRLNLAVEGNAGNLTITFQNVLCNQTGGYNISIYGGNASSVATLKVRVNPEKPNITAPLNIYKGQEAIFTCIGQLGIPNASMSWQLMLTGGKFEKYSVQGSPIISITDCSVIGNWTVQLYPEDSWNGGSIRCLITTQGISSTEIYSDTIAIALKEPVIYFAPPTSSGYIGSPHRLTCLARNMTNIRSVKIERHTAFAIRDEVASIALNGSTTSNFNGIRINSTSSISATSANIYVDFDNLTCKDEGDYYCNTSRGHISVVRSPNVPSITLPSEFIAGQRHQYISCFGEVGYPAGYIVAETNLTGTFAEYNFTDVMTDLKVNSDNCSAVYTLKFRNNIITNEWNNTRVRCLAKSNDTAPGLSSSLTSEEKVMLLIRADFCTGKVPYGKYSHPYVCSYFVTCSGAGTVLRPQVVNCGSLCFNSVSENCDWCYNVNCTQIVNF